MYQHEEAEQIALFRWAKLEEGVYPQLKYMHHIPNGGQRNKATAGRLKAAGVKAGVPDICLPYPCGGYHGLYIELKHGKNKPTDNQEQWLEFLRNAGYSAAVCYGCLEAIDVIRRYLGQEGETR